MRRFRFIARIGLLMLWALPMTTSTPPTYGQADMGEIRVIASLSEAEVLIDGKSVGKTPYGPDKFPAGVHEVIVRKQGYVEQRRVVRVVSELTTVVEVSLPLSPTRPPPLPRGPGSLRIESNPPGATVIIDGLPRGKTPLLLKGVKPGRYKVQINMSGYKESVHEVEVERGEEKFIPADLQPQGSLLAYLPWLMGILLLFAVYFGIRASRRASPGPIPCPNQECGQAFLPSEILYGCEACTEPSPRSGNPVQYKFTLEDPQNPVCPKCGHFVFEIFCPKCKERLPAGLRGVSQVHIIAIAGATNSGKTCYITSLIEALRRQRHLVTPFRFGFAFADGKSRELHENRLRQLREEGTIKKTELGMSDPLVVSLHLGRQQGAVSLMFYDVAGDTFRDEGLIATNARYLAKASTIILLVPADQVVDRNQRRRDRRRNLQEATYQLPDDVLGSILNQFGPRWSSQDGGTIPAPLAITITKIDKLTQLSATPLLQPPRPTAIVDEDELRDLTDRCRNLLSESFFDLGDLVSLAEQRFGRVGYFAVQSVRRTGSERFEIAPLRVEQPLLWALQELGFFRSGNWFFRNLRSGERMFRRAVERVRP